MKKLIPIFIFAIAIFSSCSNDVIFEETHQFPNETWQRFEPECFTFDVKNVEDCYDIYFNFRINTNVFRVEQLPFIIQLTDSEGTTRNMKTEIAIVDKNGNLNGNKIGMYSEFNVKVREYFFFNHEGKHEFLIKNGSQFFELQGITSFGLKIVKANMDLKIE